MANHLLPLAKAKILSKLIDLSPTGDTIKVVLVASTHTPSDAQEFLSDIPSGKRLAVSPALTSKTVTAGLFDAADTTWTAVPSGHTGSYAYGFLDTGTDTTSPLIWIEDTGTNIPITTNGGDITCQFNASGIFQI